MARAKLDPQVVAHLDWIGFVQPTGLVVSAPALVRAGAILDRRDAEGQRLLRACAAEREFDPKRGLEPWLPNFQSFATSMLGWSFSPTGYSGTSESPIPPELEVALPEYGETLRPDFAVREIDPGDGGPSWQLLVTVLEPGADFDQIAGAKGRLEASPHGRMERLLRRTGVSAGLLFNGRALRLISAPHGESSGFVDFRVADMIRTAGRPICTALRLLLSESRLLALPRPQRLAALLEDSRKFQNEVGERLAEQVLHALYEFLRGFQAAHDASKGELLRQPLAAHPDEVYRALLTVILRLVFTLYAEERDMLPEDETFLRHYSLAGLYERLREDSALFPDTMDQRYGAWAQLLVLFRLIYDGAEAGGMRLPKRHGVLFDPDRFTFLEGRASDGGRHIRERAEPPLVPDGTIYRALEKLLMLDGDRISYRALDVEQIGSVYETMMGFRLETATGLSVAIKAPKKHGAPTAVDLEALLAEPGAKRDKWLADRTDRRITNKIKKAAKDAATLEDLHAALLPVIDLAASPDLVPEGAMVLQPSEERRRSGSHYTPRALTRPIVSATLEPILTRLRGEDGRSPTPEQILELKVCDPAMGSGAFLVEACRQLGNALVEAWHVNDALPEIPPDEDEELFARRLIARRCIYGVDRNPVAVDLAKVSLWLVTLAKDHPLTFVDHALRHGDSLVGLSRKQIEAFHWDPEAPHFQTGFETMQVRQSVAKVTELRGRIREADESVTDWQLRELWNEAESELGRVRLFADLVMAAFFESTVPRQRDKTRRQYADLVISGTAESHSGTLEVLRHAERSLIPFHWEIEFAEVFERDNPGFDGMMGNPPYLGGTRVSTTYGAAYRDWLKCLHSEAHGNSDLVAHFFRLAFHRLRHQGSFGLIAKTTIRQGDTRWTGLRWICLNGGTIYHVIRRLPWPGQASVIVSTINVLKGRCESNPVLDGLEVSQITAFLLPKGGSSNPARLKANSNRAFIGSYVLSLGFVFDDGDKSGNANRIDVMRQLAKDDSRNSQRIFPYLGGSDTNESPHHKPSRFVINFEEMDLTQANRWPQLVSLVRERVLPQRLAQNDRRCRELWWQFKRPTTTLYTTCAPLSRVIARSLTSARFCFTFLPKGYVYDQTLVVFAMDTMAEWALLSARPHEVWSLFLGGTFKDDPRYNVQDCFETFPFPADVQTNEVVTAAGKECYSFRAELMAKNKEGLTKTYNRFHDPDEHGPDILKLRGLHSAMDQAVLEAYGWGDIPTDCEFLLDYEIDEEDWGTKKKPYRYRWPDDVRDEVLARLLELNAERAKEEARSGAATSRKKGSKKTAARRASKKTETENLFS